MDKRSAIKLLDETFINKYDEERFIKLVKEIFNEIRIAPRSGGIWKEFNDYISSFQQLGSFIDRDKRTIDILAVNLKKASSRDRARTMQRNFIAKYLLNGGKDAAVVAFYGEEQDDWRFSFVKMEYDLVRGEDGKIKEQKELTPAKRYSYLVGPNEPNHTCRSQLLDIVMEERRNPTLSELETAFSIDNVTKEFFLEYKELFHKLEESLKSLIAKDKHIRKEFEEKRISTVDFAKKLLGQIVFLHFLQKKGWLGVQKDAEGRFMEWGTGPKDFMKRLFEKKIVDYNNFYKEILEPLFYEALNSEHDNDCYTKWNCRIPFLNGGLFEPINDYNWTETKMRLDNDIFKDIFRVFNQYNFTVKEDEPLEKEVAVDPEMLGKVFENLLEVKERKDRGAFYTPREIVHYMCQQSLINYLETNTGIERKDIEIFVQYGELTTSDDARIINEINSKKQKFLKGIITDDDYRKEALPLFDKIRLPASIVENKEKIDDLLRNIKIVDPAVGSGAFPIGMLNEIIRARTTLSLFLDEERKIYDLKREIIENCLYGVDIDNSAVEIAKLRFWLSLVVDEEDMSNIKPLPNLDHKIMCGNSLLEEFEGVKLFDEKMLGEPPKDYSKEIKAIEDEIFNLRLEKGKLHSADGKERAAIDAKINRLKAKQKDLEIKSTSGHQSLIVQNESERKIAKIRELQKVFFNEESPSKKRKLRAEIEKIEWELIEATLREQGNEGAMKKLDEYKKNKSKPFFLWKLYFAEVFQRDNPGFDVVIANPPYVSAWTMEKEEPKAREIIKRALSQYSILKGHWDLYIAFVAKGHNILRTAGSLSYIVPNPILREKYAIETRKFLLKEMKLQSILEFNDINVFEGVARRTSVLVVQNTKHKSYTIGILGNESINTGFIHEINRVDVNVWLKSKSAQFLIKGNSNEDDLVNKIEAQSDKVGNFYYVNVGAQIYSKISGKFTKSDVISKEPKGNAKHFYEGKDVQRGRVRHRNLWLDYRQNDMYGPRSPELFETDKIAIRQVSNKGHILAVAYDKSKWYCDHSVILIIPYEIIENTVLRATFKDYERISHNLDLRYAFALLLSKLESYYFRKKFATESLQGSTSHTYPASVRALVMKQISAAQQVPFIHLVDHILAITKDDDYLDNPEKQARVKALEREIDKLVYELYGLTEEEIKVVEGN